jgi:hypothetical protein
MRLLFFRSNPRQDIGREENKMFVRVSIFLAILILAGLFAGCSESPVAKYDASQKTVDNARLAEAELYAPEVLKQAVDTLNAAQVEMQRQDGRFAVVRSYGDAEKMIAVAQQLAEKAVADANLEKERVRAADSSLMVEIESLLGDTKTLLASAPKGKGSRMDLKVMQSDLDAAAAALPLASEDYNAGKYISARDKLLAVKSQVEKVQGDIKAAIAKVTTK